MSTIHTGAIIEDGAQIGKNVTIEPYAIIKENVILGDNVTIKSHAYLDGYTTIGDGTIVYPSTVIGTKTQAKNYHGEQTFVKIGKNCEIREFVTINSSCGKGSTVEVGNECLIMAYCHIAHHCKIGNHVIMANGAMLAGHVEIEEYAIIGGMTPVHQFVRIGAYAMIGGLSRITHDVPPYTLGAGSPYRVAGLNLVGLKRHSFSLELRKSLTKAFKLTYRSGIQFTEALQQIESEIKKNPPINHWVDFCKTSKRGLIGLQPFGAADEFTDIKDVLEE
ncbi:MAG: acyl-ACP--UDP-N-acetylglucosamine O-acyltransferase [Simkaniaceae bacterium]|nr:acyl-ACP--UDP-N-acetylglucosamine O-acyltransferase [Simkaniaceae bacterium]